MHMVHAPPGANRMHPSFVEHPPRKASSSTPVVTAYLQHLQSKQQPNGNGDPRQTIAATPMARPIRHASSSSSQSNAPSATTTSSSSSSSAAASQRRHQLSNATEDLVAATMRSTVNRHATTHHGEQRKPKDKPPLGQKHPRSIISILTNTTYLSSDSEGDDDTSTATATVHSSDGTSTLGSRRRRRYRRHTDDSRSAGTSPSFATGNPEDANRGALIPFQPKEGDDHDDVDVTDHPHHHDHSYYNGDYMTTHSRSYDEEERHYPPDAFSYSSGEEEDDDNDTWHQLIAETSARWKTTVHETVQSTTTSAAFSTAPMVSSSVLQMQYASSSPEHVRALIQSPSSGDLSHRTAANEVEAAFPTASSQLIQEQQAEIEALRAALRQRPQQHPIQILTVPPPGPDPHGVEDDLTVWSGFHSTAPPPLQAQRPDAESTSDRVAPTRAPRLPPTPTTSLRLELSSPATGLRRTALFTGTITSQQPPPSDAAFTTRANLYVTGTGVVQFLETGDVYRGELVHSELHGNGTYTFANEKKPVLRGRFAHNVFCGDDAA